MNDDARPALRWLSWCAIFGLAFFPIPGADLTAWAGAEAHEDPFNVILITISSLRADHVSCFGYERQSTPHLDRLGRKNVLFRNAFAASGWTMPAHGALFTALPPSAHGATHIDRTLGEGHQTLAEILTDNGYYCVGFCCSPRLDAERGFGQGFHVFDDRSVAALLQVMEYERAEAFDINRRRTNNLINDAAITWLRNNRHAPFFLFVHYYDNHWDYVPPEPYRSLYDPDYTGPLDGKQIAREPLYSNPPDERDIRHLIASYDGEIRQTDEDLGELLAALEDKGLFRNSLVIVLGDHGEEFYEHGHTSHHGIYDELIHIPLVISVPGGPRRSTEALVSQVDVLPTILDYLGIPVPEACRGRSLRPVIEGRVESINEFVFVEYTGGAVPDIFAVRTLGHKCCVTARGDVFAYDLVADPQESRPIVMQDFDDRMRQLHGSLLRILTGLGIGTGPAWKGNRAD